MPAAARPDTLHASLLPLLLLRRRRRRGRARGLLHRRRLLSFLRFFRPRLHRSAAAATFCRGASSTPRVDDDARGTTHLLSKHRLNFQFLHPHVEPRTVGIFSAIVTNGIKESLVVEVFGVWVEGC